MGTVIERLAPDRGGDRDDRERVRFAVKAWLAGFPFLVVFLTIYATTHMWGQVWVQVVTIAMGVGILGHLHRGGRWQVAAQVSLGTLVASFGASSLMQTPFDPSSVFFISIVPLLAAFTMGFRTGALWVGICAAVGIGLMFLGQAGYTWPDVDELPALSMSFNFTFQLVLTLLFARTYTMERQRTLLEARAADRAKSTFLANVSHEIRTPMNAVVGMTEALLQGHLDTEQREQLEVVRRAGKSLVLLINDLLDVASLDEGRLVLAPSVFDLRALLRDVESLYAPLAGAKGLTLEVLASENLPRAVRGDALRLRQVLSNLASNAVKFTERGGVRLTALAEGDGVRFATQDTGPGIPAAVRPRLFSRFEQGDATPTRRVGGTGLGLALSRKLVRLMGGELKLDPDYAAGARFTFTLPLPEAPAPEPAAPRPLPVVARTDLPPVLVVDDNPINLAVARTLVKKAGYGVETATNGAEALAAAGLKAFALILMDVQMPVMDGLEATRQIRRLPGVAGEVPIVALTASAMPEELASCRAAGMHDALAKPIDVNLLAQVFARFIGP